MFPVTHDDEPTTYALQLRYSYGENPDGSFEQLVLTSDELFVFSTMPFQLLEDVLTGGMDKESALHWALSWHPPGPTLRDHDTERLRTIQDAWQAAKRS